MDLLLNILFFDWTLSLLLRFVGETLDLTSLLSPGIKHIIESPFELFSGFFKVRGEVCLSEVIGSFSPKLSDSSPKLVSIVKRRKSLFFIWWGLFFLFLIFFFKVLEIDDIFYVKTMSENLINGPFFF